MAEGVADVKLDDREVKKLLKKIGVRLKDVQGRRDPFVKLLSAIVIKDVTRHFEDAPLGVGGGSFIGSGGITWQRWSPSYTKRMATLGKLNNKLLNDTGRLKQGWQPGRVRTNQFGVTWFNPVKYARRQDRSRKFTWLSTMAIKDMERQTAAFVATDQ